MITEEVLDEALSEWLGVIAFNLYDTHGIPLEIFEEFIEKNPQLCKKSFLIQLQKYYDRKNITNEEEPPLQKV